MMQQHQQPRQAAPPIIIACGKARPRKVWRTFRQRQMAEADTDKQKAAIELEEKQRWLKVVISYIVEARLPSCVEVQDREDICRALQHVAGGLNAMEGSPGRQETQEEQEESG